MIQSMKIFRHLSGQADSLGLSSLTHFISGRIQNHAGMIVIFANHIFQILLPPFFKIIYIIILGFVNIPMIDVLIHHKHSLPVTCPQKCFGAGIMGAAQRIVSVFFHNTHFPFHCILITAGAQQPIVMMHTCAQQYGTFPIDTDTIFPPFQGPDAKGFTHDIFSKGHAADIKIGRIHIPKPGVRHIQGYFCFSCAVCLASTKRLFTV